MTNQNDDMTHPRARTWPLIAALLLYAAMLGVVAWIGYHRTLGQMTYVLDDAYIHMALAKNLVLHGVLGATPFEFTSASSSPLWTLLLAAVYKITGVRETTPLVLNIVFGAALVVATNLVLRVFKVGDVPRFLGMFWVIFAAPLAPIIFGGMEHPLQILIDLGFVALAAWMLARDSAEWDRFATALVLLAAGVGSIRYEGLALVGIVALLFAFRRRWLAAGAVLGAGVLPVILYGLYALSQGAYFLPNSVYVKASTEAGVGRLLQSPAAFIGLMTERLPSSYPLFPLIGASVLFAVLQLARGRSFWNARVIFPVVAVAVSCVHLVFGDIGWFFRYEDYLMVLLGLGLLLQLTDLFAAGRPTETALQWAVLSLAALLVIGGALASAKRGNIALRSTPWAVKNVYEQMYQLAHFVKANPQYNSIAIGDLGAISYYNDNVRILDLEGLALRGVPMNELGKDRLSAARIRELAKRNSAQIAIIFPDYFDQPAEWIEVGRWTIRDDIVTGGDTVSFLAIPPTDPAALRAALQRYSDAGLPPSVTVSIP